MNLQDKIAEKEELLGQVVKEINERKEQMEKLTAEITQLETQGYVVQGAILAYKELIEETEAPSPEVITE